MIKNKINRSISYLIYILSAIVIIPLLIYSLSIKNNKKILEEGRDAADQISINEKDKMIAGFVSYLKDEHNKMLPDYMFTSEGLLKLTEAIHLTAAVIAYDIPDDLEKVKEYADKITKDSLSNRHAGNVRKAADILTNSLQHLQEAGYPQLANEVNDVQIAGASINPRLALLNQKAEIKTFFNKASILLQKMK